MLTNIHAHIPAAQQSHIVRVSRAETSTHSTAETCSLSLAEELWFSSLSLSLDVALALSLSLSLFYTPFGAPSDWFPGCSQPNRFVFFALLLRQASRERERGREREEKRERERERERGVD